MQVTPRIHDTHAVLVLNGRLDAYGSQNLEEAVKELLQTPKQCLIIFEMSGLSYLSSAGIRVLLATYKAQKTVGQKLYLAGLQGYCAQVLNMTGFSGQLPTTATVEEALKAEGVDQDRRSKWGTPFAAPASGGILRHSPWSQDAGEIRVLGHIEDVLYSRVTLDKVHAKRFSETEFSIGLGALGAEPADYMPLFGEMMTIGSAMVWLPTDGHDTPDYLIPKTDTGEVTIRTGFNVSLHGDFNDLFLFESDSKGATLAEIYRDLFAWAKQNRPDFKGALEVTLRAEMKSVYGSGVLFSTIAENAPKNGEMITHPDNFSTWFEIDQQPRYENVTGLITGVGIDLNTDLASYDPERLGACFYINPGNKGAADQMLHNHGVFFKPQPFPENPVNIQDEIHQVIDQGEFVDMRHLLDDCVCTRALIGVSAVQQFVADPEGRPVSN